MTRRFAEDTRVPVAKSRSEIDGLLRGWGAAGVQWTDDWETSVVTLRFRWPHGSKTFAARMTIKLPSAKDLEPLAVDNRSGGISERKLDKLLADRGKREHRLLLLLIKSTLNAVDAGVISDVEAFLPYLEGKDGRTVGEVGRERLGLLATGSAAKLLPGGPT